MDERTQLAADILDAIQGELWKRSLVAQEAVQARPSAGAARSVARLEGRLLAPDRARVGKIRVVVMVPGNASDPVQVNLLWKRNAYGFWFDKTMSLGELQTVEDADLTGIGMVLTAVGWSASGSVALRSLIRTFHKVRQVGWWA